MLLVLAPSADETAARILESAKVAGIEAIRESDIAAFRLSVRANPDLRTSVTITTRDTNVPITAVINRGIGLTERGAGEFEAGEVCAGWWTALACFEGPVLNRPTRMGFLPDLQPGIFENAAGIAPTDIRFVMGCYEHRGPRAANVHRLHDGLYLGRVGTDPSILEFDDAVKITYFDPAATIHVIVAGDRLFDLTESKSELHHHHAAQLKSFQEWCHTKGIYFAIIVLEPNGGYFRVLSGSVLPAFQQYRAVEKAVHSSLLEFLDP
jgi:hypothetical protein